MRNEICILRNAGLYRTYSITSLGVYIFREHHFTDSVSPHFAAPAIALLSLGSKSLVVVAQVWGGILLMGGGQHSFLRTGLLVDSLQPGGGVRAGVGCPYNIVSKCSHLLHGGELCAQEVGLDRFRHAGQEFHLNKPLTASMVDIGWDGESIADSKLLGH